MSLKNLNPVTPIADADLPGSITRDPEYIAADKAHVDAVDPHSQYLNQSFADTRYLFQRPTGIEFAENSANYLDFHTGSPPKDFDGRIIVSGGGNSNGLANILMQFATLQLNATFSLYGAAQISRLLSVQFSIDLPTVAAGGVAQVTQNIPGGVAGDVCFFAPLQMPSGLNLFKIMAVVATSGIATIHFHNLSTSALDIVPFSSRILVIGFL